MKLYLARSLEPHRARIKAVIEDAAKGIISLDKTVVNVAIRYDGDRFSGRCWSGATAARSPKTDRWMGVRGFIHMTVPVPPDGPGSYTSHRHIQRGKPLVRLAGLTWDEAFGLLVAHEVGHEKQARLGRKRTGDQIFCDKLALKWAERKGFWPAKHAPRPKPSWDKLNGEHWAGKVDPDSISPRPWWLPEQWGDQGLKTTEVVPLTEDGGA